MARDDEQLRSSGFDLLFFLPAMLYSFLVIWRKPYTTSGATAKLVRPVGIEVQPVFRALIHDPARLFIVAMAKHHLRLPTVVARIVVGSQLRVSGLVDLDPAFFDVLNK